MGVQFLKCFVAMRKFILNLRRHLRISFVVARRLETRVPSEGAWATRRSHDLAFCAPLEQLDVLGAIGQCKSANRCRTLVLKVSQQLRQV